MMMLFIDWYDMRGDFRETAWMRNDVSVVAPGLLAHRYPLVIDAFWLDYEVPDGG